MQKLESRQTTPTSLLPFTVFALSYSSLFVFWFWVFFCNLIRVAICRIGIREEEWAGRISRFSLVRITS